MSIWTHVNGSIRVDHIRNIFPEIDFKSIFKTASWKDEDWDDCNMPCGSEGSLNVNIWTSPDPTNMAAYTVNIFGDLRGYDDSAEIIDWFHGLITETFHDVRDAVLTIKVEDAEFITLTLYEGEMHISIKGNDSLSAKYALLGFEVVKIN